MQIINPNVIPISSFETWELIKEIKQKQETTIMEEISKKQEGGSKRNERDIEEEIKIIRKEIIPENLNEIITHSLQYFECNSSIPQSKFTPTSFSDLCLALRNQFSQISGKLNGISKAERLQICDLAPTELVELYLIIEECDSRFTETEIESILNLVKQNISDRPLKQDDHPMDTGMKGTNAQEDVNLFGPEMLELDENFDLGDVDDDDALVAEAREGGPAPDQELDEVPD